MARNLLNFPFQPYQGSYSAKPFRSSRGTGQVVTVDIPWFTYLSIQPGNFAVTCNMQASGPNALPSPWLMQSVYIDNEGVDFPVYVYFPDTQHTVSCPPNAAGWYEVFTSGLIAIVAGMGITNNSLQTQERTRLFFTDVPMVPFLDQEQQSAVALELASPNFPRFSFNSVGYGTPALGDQSISAEFNCIGVGTSTGALSPAGAGLFYYLTGIYANIEIIGSGISGPTEQINCHVDAW